MIWVFILYKGMNTEMKIFLVQELQCGSYQIKGMYTVTYIYSLGLVCKLQIEHLVGKSVTAFQVHLCSH